MMACRRLSLIYTGFLIFLIIGSLFGEWLFYTLSVLFAVFLVFLFRTEMKGAGDAIRPTVKGLCFLYPTLLLVMLVAWFSSTVFSLFGIPIDGTVPQSPGEAILCCVVLPAVCEEFYFRLLPMVFLRGRQKTALFFSAAAFGLLHADLTVLPYAFAAGLCFMAVDLAYGSVFPSLVFHLCNNALSYLSLSGVLPASPLLLCGVLLAATAASLPFILKEKEELKERFRFSDTGEGWFSPATALPVFVSLFLAVLRIYVSVTEGGV